MRYRSRSSIQAWRVGPPDSVRVSRVPTYLGSFWAYSQFRIQGYHLLCRCFPTASAIDWSCRIEVPQPRPVNRTVCSPLLAESRLISSPAGTEMFHFPASRFPHLWIQYGIVEHYFHWVSPFGYLRIKTRVQFPEAFRSLPRPSSPDRAKASFMCP